MILNENKIKPDTPSEAIMCTSAAGDKDAVSRCTDTFEDRRVNVAPSFNSSACMPYILKEDMLKYSRLNKFIKL